MTGRIILPIAGVSYICRLEGDQVTPLTPLPGSKDARCFPCYASGYVAVVDSNRKRIGLFELIDQAPWVQEILVFSTLPGSCVAHAALPLEGGLLVGGHAKTAEALWWRHPQQTIGQWVPIDLPPAIRKPGKAIDGLHRDGRQLIAVDDIVTPKWLVIYQLEHGPGFAQERLVELPSHDSYERVVESFLGSQRLWCLSRSVNYGMASTHLWGLDRVTFKEDACWSIQDQSKSRLDVAATHMGGELQLPNPLETACAAVEWQGQLLVACQDNGAIHLPIFPLSVVQDPRRHTRLPLVSLASVTRIQIHPDQPARGVFLAGTRMDGVPDWQWLPADLINVLAATPAT